MYSMCMNMYVREDKVSLRGERVGSGVPWFLFCGSGALCTVTPLFARNFSFSDIPDSHHSSDSSSRKRSVVFHTPLTDFEL
jgi:hypothetical protein